MNSTEPFSIERTFDAPVSKVWKALTYKDQMKQWYFDLSEFKAEPGFRFSFSGKGRKGEDYVHLCEVKEVIPEQKLVYSWTYKDQPGYSEVKFELFEEDGKTRVNLTHSGLESFASNGADFQMESFAEGWDQLVGKLLGEFLAK